MLLDDIVCETSVALDAQRAVHCCITTPIFLHADLALLFFGVLISVQLHGLLLGLGCKSRKPRIPRDHLQSGPPTKLT